MCLYPILHFFSIVLVTGYSIFSQVTTFSEYCEEKFVIEPVEVISSDGNSCIYPDLSIYNMEVSLSYINGLIGVPLEMEEVFISCNFLLIIVAVLHNL